MEITINPLSLIPFNDVLIAGVKSPNVEVSIQESEEYLLTAAFSLPFPAFPTISPTEENSQKAETQNLAPHNDTGQVQQKDENKVSPAIVGAGLKPAPACSHLQKSPLIKGDSGDCNTSLAEAFNEVSDNPIKFETKHALGVLDTDSDSNNPLPIAHSALLIAHLPKELVPECFYQGLVSPLEKPVVQACPVQLYGASTPYADPLPASDVTPTLAEQDTDSLAMQTHARKKELILAPYNDTETEAKPFKLVPECFYQEKAETLATEPLEIDPLNTFYKEKPPVPEGFYQASASMSLQAEGEVIPSLEIVRLGESVRPKDGGHPPLEGASGTTSKPSAEPMSKPPPLPDKAVQGQAAPSSNGQGNAENPFVKDNQPMNHVQGMIQEVLQAFSPSHRSITKTTDTLSMLNQLQQELHATELKIIAPYNDTGMVNPKSQDIPVPPLPREDLGAYATPESVPKTQDSLDYGQRAMGTYRLSPIAYYSPSPTLILAPYNDTGVESAKTEPNLSSQPAGEIVETIEDKSPVPHELPLRDKLATHNDTGMVDLSSLESKSTPDKPHKDLPTNLITNEHNVAISPSPLDGQTLQSAKEVPKTNNQHVIPELHYNNLIEQIAQKARAYLREGRWDMKLRLDPPELGHIKLKFSVTGNRLEASIEVENPNVMRAVEKDISHLKESISSAGINVERLDVFCHERNDGHHFAQHTNPQTQSTIEEGTDTETVEKPDEGLAITGINNALEIGRIDYII